MNELNNVIDAIFVENVEKLRKVLVKNLIKDCIDLVMGGIATQSSTEEIKFLADKISHEKLYEFCLNALCPTEEDMKEKMKRREKAKNMELAIDVVINAIDELISKGELKVEGVLDKNKLFDQALKNEVL